MEHRYLYDAANRLSLSMNAEGRVSGYRYNGLGQRTGIQEYMLTGFVPETPFSEEAIACACAGSGIPSGPDKTIS